MVVEEPDKMVQLIHIPIVGVIAMEQLVVVVVVVVVVVRDGRPENELDSKAPQVSQESEQQVPPKNSPFTIAAHAFHPRNSCPCLRMEPS